MVKQNYSLFNSIDYDKLREWHTPYAQLFKFSTKVLDVGCGNGIFLSLLQECGVEATGIDIDPELVSQLIVLGFNAHHACHEDVDRFAHDCDGIHISHVIEHLWGEEMKRLLESCAASLGPAGLLVIRTPNWANKHVCGGGFWDDYTHKRPYTLRQLERMLVDMGFTIRASGHEPFGWEDTFVVARKNPCNPGLGSDNPTFPYSNKASKGFFLVNKIRRKVKHWLLAD